MANAKKSSHGEESRHAILRGVNQLADVVKVTWPEVATWYWIVNWLPTSPKTG